MTLATAFGGSGTNVIYLTAEYVQFYSPSMGVDVLGRFF